MFNLTEMTQEEATAYQWAKAQNYQSVAAQYAKTLANYIERADAVDPLENMTPEEIGEMIAGM